MAEHDHDHSHAHGHAGYRHHIEPGNFGRAFLIAVVLNSLFVVIEFAYGFVANPTALIADAGHNLGVFAQTAQKSHRI